jgi:hypothetical protein
VTEGIDAIGGGRKSMDAFLRKSGLADTVVIEPPYPPYLPIIDHPDIPATIVEERVISCPELTWALKDDMNICEQTVDTSPVLGSTEAWQAPL